MIEKKEKKKKHSLRDFESYLYENERNKGAKKKTCIIPKTKKKKISFLKIELIVAQGYSHKQTNLPTLS